MKDPIIRAINKFANFIIFIVLRIRKGVNPSDAYSQLLGYRQVTINANKQEQFTPIGREPSELLALALEYFAGIRS